MATVDEDILVGEVRCAAEGDRAAFGRLVESHQSMVCSVAYSVTGSFAASEEVAQEAFCTAWRRLSQLRDPSRFASWLAAIARNTAKDAVRKQGREAGVRGGVAEGKAGEPVDEAAMRAEREQVTWEAVSGLPDAYRIALVLYYREEKSVREMARQLGISEECARQRLSRGRKMLRDRLSAVIEETLRESRPSQVFTLAVMAALPALVAPAAGAATVAAGAAATKAGGLGAKSASGVLGAGLLGSIVGPVAGMTGGFFGMWAGIKNAQTLNLRRYMLRISAVTYAFVWLFLGYEAGCGTLLWRRPVAMGLACGAGWALYLPLLFLLITWSNRKGRKILEAEEEGAGAPAGCGLAAVWRTFWWAFSGAVLGSASVVLWVHLLPGVSGWLGLVIAAVSHAGFLLVFRRGVAIARDEVVFEETAPESRGVRDEGAEAEARSEASDALVMPSWRNDCLALCGGILGSSLALIVPLAEEGALAWSLGVACAQVAVVLVALGLLRLARRWRVWILFGALVLAGEINGAVIFLRPMAWLGEYAVQAGDGVGMSWRILAAGVCFGIYFVVGLALLFVGRKRRS